MKHYPVLTYTRCSFVMISVLLVCSVAYATEFEVRIDRGEDLGQNFGSLFEARTEEGAYVIGAGFSGTYNTYYRHDRHMVHFYVRPTSESRPLQATPLPRPGELAGNYLFNFDGKVYAAYPDVRVWDDATSTWKAPSASNRIDTRLGKDLLSFEGSTVLLNGETVLKAPEKGSYSRFYYAQGHLFFYHVNKVDDRGYRLYVNDADGFTKLYACPWTPSDGAIDLSKAIVMTVPVVGENPYAYGQLGNQVLSCSNIGGVYAFREGEWRTVVEGELKTSYQVYTMLTYYDQLLMGQYPTGELFSFDGETVRQLKGWPPVMKGVSGSSREAQTMALYGGELYVGVWPWGEVWRYHADLNKWTLAKRMFTHPALTDTTTHPYENECKALEVVLNQWGQRVTGMVPLNDSLLISTSAKWPCEWEEKFNFVKGGAWKEYGAVTQVHSPGHLSASVRWTEEKTELRFVLEEQEMRIEQDGEVIGTATLSDAMAGASNAAKQLTEITWGKGAYGVFTGNALKGDVK